MVKSLVARESVSVEVDSRPRWCATGVGLEGGATYELTAAGTWVDWFEKNRCGPEGYASNTLLLRWAERWRNERSQPWFALIGAVSSDARTQFPIGRRRVHRPETAGELTCFANDVPLMRWNNSGCVTLTVTRTG